MMIPDETILDLIKALAGLWVTIVVLIIVSAGMFNWAKRSEQADIKRRRAINYPSAVNKKLTEFTVDVDDF